MTVLVAGCSLSSGWGFDNPADIWPNLVSHRLKQPLINLAHTSSSNGDIFLSAIRAQDLDYDLRLIQWTALNRITVSSSPVNNPIILSFHDQFLEQAIPGISVQEIQTFTKILSHLNQDWKHYFDLIDMIEILQQDPRTCFINGLLPWNREFFETDWTIPLSETNNFLESLLQVNEFADRQLAQFLNQVLTARNRVDVKRWISLDSWESAKIDTVSATDPHPGPLSQIKYADQVLEYILV